jgi:aryl-alcohol dehydrogenase-like predicted oxidoreductase
LARLRQAGTEVHARSVFLQGLLLMTGANRPARFNRWQSLWDEWHRWLNAAGVSPLQACIRFAVANGGFDRLVVGVESRMQLREILANLDTAPPQVPATLQSEDLDLINPSRWNVQ